MTAAAAVLLLATAWAPPPAHAAATMDAVRDELRARIESRGESGGIVALGLPLRVPASVAAFYWRRGFRPAWTDGAAPAPRAADVASALASCDGDGLDASDYRADAIVAALAESRPGARAPAAERLAELDLLLSDSFLLLAAHLSRGKVDPDTRRALWDLEQCALDTAVLMEAAVGADAVPAVLERIRPPVPEYEMLRRRLGRYRALARAGGWPALSPGPPLRFGDRGPRVDELRARLAQEDERLALDPAAPDGFDPVLEGAVQRFQRRHGLPADGRVGAAVNAALAVPAHERARQIEVSLERMRWLGRIPGQRRIVVNAAGAELYAYEGGRRALTMRAVVGRPARPTPLLTQARIERLVWNPVWNVPPQIAARDLLPSFRADPGRVFRDGFHVSLASDPSQEIDPLRVDWTSVTPRGFPFVLRQEPGERNPMGRVKFEFPNPYGVALHDTPSRRLFAGGPRRFSSGCIRIQKPVELCEFVLRGAHWTKQDVEAAMRGERNRTCPVPDPPPVHVVYWTAWADADGTVHFRTDGYGEDDAVLSALRERAPDDATAGYAGPQEMAGAPTLLP